MRFRDIRTTEYKRVDTGVEPAFTAATPLRLSPFKPDGVSVREGVNAADMLRPQYNRKSRRAMGRVRPRRRIGGVALISKPWETVHEESIA